MALTIMAIVLAIVLGLSIILVGQLRIVRAMGFSVVALYAADTGAERALYDIYNNDRDSSIASSIGSTPIGSASYSAEIKCCQPGLPNSNCKYQPNECPIGLSEDGTCDAEFICVRSRGIYQNTSRALELKL